MQYFTPNRYVIFSSFITTFPDHLDIADYYYLSIPNTNNINMNEIILNDSGQYILSSLRSGYFCFKLSYNNLCSGSNNICMAFAVNICLSLMILLHNINM